MRAQGWAGRAAVEPARRQAGRPAGRSRQQMKQGRRPFAAVVERWADSQDTDYSAAGAGRGADSLLDRRRQADSCCPADTRRRRGSRRHTDRDTRRRGSGYPAAAVHSLRRRSRGAAGTMTHSRRRDIGGSRWEGRAAVSSGREEVKGRPRSDWRPPWWPGRSGSGAAATANTEKNQISFKENPF
jgi:hypothetical protein